MDKFKNLKTGLVGTAAVCARAYIENHGYKNAPSWIYDYIDWDGVFDDDATPSCIYDPIDWEQVRDGEEVPSWVYENIDLAGIFEGYDTAPSWIYDYIDWDGVFDDLVRSDSETFKKSLP